MLLKLKRGVTEGILLVLVFNILAPGLPVFAETILKERTVFEKSVEQSSTTENLYYSKLMREVREIKEGEVENLEQARTTVTDDLKRFIPEEEVRLKNLGVNEEKQKKYFEVLHLQLENITSQTKETTLPMLELLDSIRKLEVKPLEKPSRFHFDNEEVIIKPIKIPTTDLSVFKRISGFTKSLIGMETAYAIDAQYMPVIEDIQSDDEIIISSAIRDLAHDLNNNPVEIVNYIQNNISYEPYFGAKKGSVGCLREQICNDIDTASLTIALMRAAGIPARYKKGLAIMTVEQLQNLLGVDETKTAYYSLYTNNIPVYTMSGTQVGSNIDEADFSQETHFAVEWVYPEIFYDYDERGGNIPNTVNLSGIETTGDLQTLFLDSTKKQWIPIDAAVKEYDRTQNEIVHDTANFDTEAFWYNFLQYQGELSPIAKYTQDLQSQTGKDITLQQYQSSKEIRPHQFDILPYRLPYGFMEGVDGDGYAINIETWSQLPNNRRYQVTISLLRGSDSSEVFSHTFFGSEINNQPIDLVYQGATATDKAVIESYGGIHATPAALVDIQPYLLTDAGRYETQTAVSIGESLIMQFEYIVNGESIHTDQKFSTAGNQEGIYIVLSKTAERPYLDDGLNDNSEILLEGNTGLAWKYIKEVEEEMQLLEKSLDYEYNFEFFRAVVTQNRVLSEVGGIPTTFDFKGLTMDASSYVNDYSNRGKFKTHQDDFRLLWGQEASFYEGQLFTDVAGLEGISTVKGLQYAYANPQTYTIHHIDSGNESVIDTLSLSSNTKSNMHADVQAGNTIITPDKPVTHGTFTGTLYISLDPEKTGLYAIGEQVANGGWSTDVVFVELDCDEECIETYQVDNFPHDEKYIYADLPVDSVSCKIAISDFDDIKNNVNAPQNPKLWEIWGPGYGPPCLKGVKNFEEFEHIFVLATHGAKFVSSDYYYWVPREIAKNTIHANTSNFNDDKFKFNPIAGTYSHNADEAVYYEPKNPSPTPPPGYDYGWTDMGVAWAVTGELLEKLMAEHYDPNPNDEENGCEYGDAYCGKKNWVLNKLGYPIETESLEESTPHGGEGTYQTFIGGRIYNEEDNLGDDTYYVPAAISKKIDSIESCVNGQCESGLPLIKGFPVMDPDYDSDNQIVSQDFENNETAIWNILGGFLDVSFTEYEKYSCEEYGDTNNSFKLSLILLHGVVDSGIITAEELIDLGINILKIWKWDDYANSAYYIIVDLVQLIDETGVLEFIETSGSAALQGLKAQYNEAIVDGCPARRAYLKGKVMGAVAQAVLGAVALKAVSKLKLLRSLDDPKYLSKFKYLEDDSSVDNLVNDKKLLNRIKNSSFYNKFKIKKVYDSDVANAQHFPDYDNPVPFTPGTKTVDLEVTDALSNSEFVRFHGDLNKDRPWILKGDDIPYKNGKIDLDKIRQDFNIDDTADPINAVSKYVPNKGDVIVEGKINGGNNELFQYGIRYPEIIPDNKLIEDHTLTLLLP